METLKQISTGFTATVATVILTLSFTVVPMQSANAWWKCSSGYTLQLKNNNSTVRCYKAGTTHEKNTLSCPKVKVPGTNIKVGTKKKKNYKGNKDKCVVLQSGYNIPVGCSAGYSLVTKSGWDKCRKTTTAKEKQPTSNVS